MCAVFPRGVSACWRWIGSRPAGSRDKSPTTHRTSRGVGGCSARPWPGAARRQPGGGGGGAVRSPLVTGSTSWACCSGEHPWQLRAWIGQCSWILWQQMFPPVGKSWPSALRLPSRAEPHRHRPGVAEHLFVGPAPAASLWSTGDAGGTSALVAVSQASGLVDTAGATAITTPTGDHRNMAWLQAFRFKAALASAAWGWLAVHRPLKCLYA